MKDSIRYTFALLGSLVAGSPALAVFPAGNPLNAVVPQTTWSIEVEDVVTIPNSGGSSPRIENLVAGGAPGLAYVIDQRGPIWSFDPTAPNPASTRELFVDIDSVVSNLTMGQQTGVRGLAFHPDFNNAGTDGYRKFYTAISRDAFSPADSNPADTIFFPAPNSVNHDSIVAEFTVDAGGDVINSSFRQVLGVGQRFNDHNIGEIGFNPLAAPGDADYGKLYIGLGDGGNNFPPIPIDPNDNGQNLNRPHGSILRIDPLADGTAGFSIPTDNPLRVSNERDVARNLIWAYGLRNPHNFAWDPVSGKMLIADIGQSNIEEINLGAAGANYGWRDREGTFITTGQFSGSHNIVDDLPNDHATDDLTYPVAQYDHDFDNNGFRDSLFAVAGGSVYRGDAVPELRGLFFFGDFSERSTIFAVPIDELAQREDFSDLESLSDGRLAPYEQVRFTENGIPRTWQQIVGSNRTNLRFGEGPDGELYLLNKADGTIRRFASVTGLLAGDFNADGRVDAADYTVWRDGLGDRYSEADYEVWQANFGATSSATTASVPEPTAAVLFAIAACGWCRRPRR
ncbi:MAG: PQQ-dependent sugar dehydrogenase [Planctomycetota bacterium]